MWRRLIYLGVIFLWLLVICFPIASFALATRGEISFGDRVHSGLRIFLVQEDDAQGIGIEWSRRLRVNPQCSKTGVRYLLWEGRGSDFSTEYCLCYKQEENGSEVTSICQ